MITIMMRKTLQMPFLKMSSQGCGLMHPLPTFIKASTIEPLGLTTFSWGRAATSWQKSQKRYWDGDPNTRKPTQRLQNPLLKEYTLNHIRAPIIV